MAAVVILGLVVSSVVFFALFFVKICGETSGLKICKVLRLDTEPSSNSTTIACDKPDLRTQPGNKAESNTGLLEMPKRVA